MNKLWSLNWQDSLIVSLIVISFCSLFFIEPISQDLAYHAFADNRNMLGVNNFSDVISNLPFLIIGILGLYTIYQNWGTNYSWSWLFLFLSIFLVAIGSCYYHLSPENKTLTWDRLPMAIGFMALFVLIASDYINNCLEKWLLVPMCLIGIFSVIYWHMTDDLRMYAWVQFAPIALLIIIIFIYKPTQLQTKYLLFAFFFYTLSKISEHFDKQIYELLNQMISGHTIKHLLAAVATYFFYLLFKHRIN